MTQSTLIAGVSDKAPPVVVGGGVSVFNIYGIPLPELVQWATLIYVVFCAINVLIDIVKKISKHHEKQDCSCS